MSKPRVKLTDKDHGYRKMLQSIAKLGGPFAVTVGIHSEEAEGGGDGVSVLDKANWLEFGTANAPARTPISGFADEHGAEFQIKVRDDMALALKAGKNPIQRVDQLAQSFAGAMQSNFPNLTPNAPETIARKGSSTPGVEDGQTRAAIRGKVEK